MAESRCILRTLDFLMPRPRRQTAALRPPRHLIRRIRPSTSVCSINSLSGRTRRRPSPLSQSPS
eukprot:2970880-Pleurochrysis_carterae.AAC.1